VVAVAQKAAAFKAGLRPKDVILHLNDHKIADADQFQDLLGHMVRAMRSR